jgi:transcription elongation factor Elf1
MGKYSNRYLHYLIPTACLLFSFENRQKNKAANRFPCSNCGNILGKISIDLADAEQSEFMQRVMRENPEMRIQPADQTIYAICSSCGARFTYLNKDRLFKIDTKNSSHNR